MKVEEMSAHTCTYVAHHWSKNPIGFAVLKIPPY